MEGEIIISLLTLTFMEIVLGIDNIIFISIISNRLPEERQPKARTIGLMLAMVLRVLLLLAISWIARLTVPLFEIQGFEATGRDLILFAGGLFLLAKSTTEIHSKLEGQEEHKRNTGAVVSFSKIIVQILLLDLVFSFDSILTAIGLVNQVWIMIVAVVVAMIIMLVFSGAIAKFINKHPTIKMLALSFLLLIGFMLVIEGLHFHVPKGYIYFAIFFSLFVEMLNLRMRRKSKPIQLRLQEYKEKDK